MRLGLILLSAALLTLPGCNTMAGPLAGPVLDASVPVKPVDIADKTTLDERLGTGVTIGYTAASRLGAALARVGLIDKVRFKAVDNKGYEAVLAVRSAYLAGNATSYSAAIDRVNAAVADINTLVR